MITLEEYKNHFGNEVPSFNYTSEFLVKEFIKLKNKSIISGISLEPIEEGIRTFTNYVVKSKSSNYQFVYQFFPNYFSIRTKKFEPLINVFKDDKRLQKSIDINNKYYGHLPFNLTSFIRSMSMSSNVYRAGNFPPLVAKYIYDTYTTDNETVFDFSAGFGGRMLGAMASRNKINYVGIDPHLQTFNGLCDLYHFLQMNLFTHDYNGCDIVNSNIEEYTVPEELKGKVAVCFSSPPFYDLELYAEEGTPYADTQASYMYKTKEDFMEGFFGAVTTKCYDMLKEDGLLIINMKDSDRKKTVTAFLDYMKTTKFIESTHILMYMNNMTHGTSLGKEVRKEPIFVFRKGK